MKDPGFQRPLTVGLTGTSGYIGSKLLQALNDSPFVGRIIGIDIQPPKASPPKLTFYRQSVTEPFGKIFSESKVDSAIHLAFVLMPSRDWDRVRSINIGGSANFLKACQEAGVKHAIYLSSYAAYGARPDNLVPFTETSPLRPNEGFQYSLFKAETDRLFQDFASANRETLVTILRAPVVMGPTADNQITGALLGAVMIGVRGYDPPMQFVHEDDLVRLILTLLQARQPGIYNVAGAGTIRYGELARLAGKRLISLPGSLLHLAMGITWRLRLQGQSPPEGLDFIKYPVVLSTEKLEQETGFRFRYSSWEAAISLIEAKLIPNRRL